MGHQGTFKIIDINKWVIDDMNSSFITINIVLASFASLLFKKLQP
jgi:hypothetical protein